MSRDLKRAREILLEKAHNDVQALRRLAEGEQQGEHTPQELAERIEQALHILKDIQLPNIW
jgi:hypothetical protein